LAFKREILRKIFGPMQAKWVWRIRYNKVYKFYGDIALEHFLKKEGFWESLVVDWRNAVEVGSKRSGRSWLKHLRRRNIAQQEIFLIVWNWFSSSREYNLSISILFLL
jgi:hypothetical protein